MRKRAKNMLCAAQSNSLARAKAVIKSDRMGVSAGIESIVSREVSEALADFFALDGSAETDISATEKGFFITVKAKAKSVKEFKIIG